MDIVGLSETRRPGSGEISSRDFTYYWSAMINGAHLRGVAIEISSIPQPFVVEVTPVNERIYNAIEAKAHLGINVFCCSVLSNPDV